MSTITSIRELFDSSRKIDREIERVITYSSESTLAAEISEYVVTDNLEERFFELLSKMHGAMSGPGGQGQGGHEIGVWVSGFYGSGKSSFTKYLGFALDRKKKLGERTFLSLLQDRLRKQTTKALFNTVSALLDPHVVFLDLASEMTAGGGLADVSTILRNKVLRDAGFSSDIKVAELEMMLEADGKLEEFKRAAQAILEGAPWEKSHNSPLIANTVGGRLAHQFYPQIWVTPSEFSHVRINSTVGERERVKEMIDLVKKKSGKKNIIFIVDEVGQYVAAKPDLILNLDGFSKNLKELGGGTVWLFATAQQTLTEDSRQASINSPDLYKLKDRFPIAVHLEAADIKEICHKRLLTKSTQGDVELNSLFQQFGPSLRTATHLRDAKHYTGPLDEEQFRSLYPFLPAHFEILLQLLGKLAKKTGGLGLRSALKVLQDVLVDKSAMRGGVGSLADKTVGTLANTVTFYDSLEREIRASFSQVADGVTRVKERFGQRSEPFLAVAKTIAILQILENLPATISNIAALMQAGVQSPSLVVDVSAVASELLRSDSMVPLSEKDGRLTFLSQAALEYQKELENLGVRAAEERFQMHEALKSIFEPLPTVLVAGTRGVQAGLRVTQGGGTPATLAGEKNTLQWLVDLVEPSQYTAQIDHKVQVSRTSAESRTLFIQAKRLPAMADYALAAARCKSFLDTKLNVTDPELKNFRATVEQKQERALAELTRLIREELLLGSFIALGTREAVALADLPFAQAAKQFLGQTAQKVYCRYAEAAYQGETGLAEKFLKTALDQQTTTTDPLQLVHKHGGKPMINLGHKALTTVRDYLTTDEGAEVEGRSLLDHFSDPPFGWSKDTTRYLIAGLLFGGEIKLRIAGADHAVRDEETLKALASNKALGTVSLQLRNSKPDPEHVLMASNRLKELVGEEVLPLEEEIARVARKHLPQLQLGYSALSTTLRNFPLLDLCHAKRAEELAESLATVLQGDGTDVISRFGKKESPLNDSLLWARMLTKSLADGLSNVLQRLMAAQTEWSALPNQAVTAGAHQDAKSSLETATTLLKEEHFYKQWIQLQGLAQALEKGLQDAKQSLVQQHNEGVQADLQARMRQEGFQSLKEEAREQVQNTAKGAMLSDGAATRPAIELLKELFDCKGKATHVAAMAKQLEDAAKKLEEDDQRLPVEKHEIQVPAFVTTKGQVDLLVDELKKLGALIDGTKAVQIVWKSMKTDQGS